jgi:type II secretory ATPase GspE/PulE/Tfp pilus assembly ATPase PilB-like protein
MGIEPYQITSALFGVATQRLLRRKAEEGYGRRVPVSEVARMDEKLREMVLQRADAGRLAQALADQPDHRTMADEARELVTDRITDQAEADRVLGASRAEH